MPAQLIALTEGSNILLDKPILLLGRHPECDVQIESRKISRRHCCIAQVNGHLVVRDLGSTNGIRINGTRTLEGKLGADDELTIGNSRYKVRWETIGDEPKPREKPVPQPMRRTELDDDEILESCEEPVPLADPDNPAAPAHPVPFAPESIVADSIILPDHLDLAPIEAPPPNAG
jgi:predicted component of type VI protein secretion system